MGVSKYIENNPVRAVMVQRPDDYPYSSARAHVLGMKDPLLKEPLFDKSELNEYRKFVKIEDDKKALNEIRKRTRSGKPLGDGGFLKTLSGKLGCSLSFRAKGRPRKKNLGIGELRD